MEVLVRKTRKHDKSAFVELMKNAGSDLYKVGKAILKDDEDVADAMQETALNCWEKIDTLKNDGYFRTWLTRIMINNCYGILRQKKKTVSTEDAIIRPGVAEDGYENVEWKEFLNCLDEKHRVVVILYYVPGFKTREIAKLLDLNESTVRGRLKAAREKMERQYGVVDGTKKKQNEIPKNRFTAPMKLAE